MSAINESWELFFRNCGLPKNVHRKYAQRFVKERIQPSMLNDIGKSELIDLGVETLGDQLCILRYVKSTNGIFYEFRDANKQRITAAAVVQPHNDDDIYMDSDFNDMEDEEEPIKVTVHQLQARKPVSSNSELRGIARKVHAGASSTARLSVARQSMAIGKKPSAVMIHDVSSSSSLPMVGKMRSDDISLKTMVIANDSPRRGPTSRRIVKSVLPACSARASDSRIRLLSRLAPVLQREPDFRVRLDMRPQVRYDDVALFDDAAESVSASRGSRHVASGGDFRGEGIEARRSVGVAAAEWQRPMSNGRRLLAEPVSSFGKSRKRPVVTVAGRRVGAGSGGGRSSGSILNRISIVPK